MWTYDPPERDAKLAQDAVKMNKKGVKNLKNLTQDAVKMNKKGVKHLKILVELACASSPHHLMAVRQAYSSLFDSSLEEDIASNVAPPLSKVKKKKH